MNLLKKSQSNLNRYENNKDLFIINVKKCIELGNNKIYENPPINSDDPHAIR